MTLHLQAFGAAGGQPLVALHGAGAHGRRWRALAERHLPGMRTYAPDLRGHGRSPWQPPWSLEQHAVDVLATMDAAGLGRVPVVGHSLGAVVALHLARAAPQRVAGLVLLDPGLAVPGAVAERRAVEALHAPSFADPAEAAAQQARAWPGDEVAVADEVADHLERGADGRWRWRYSAPMLVTSFSEVARPAVLPPAGMPTLLVVGRRSRAVPTGYAEACRDAVGAGFRLAELDCGHLLYREAPAGTGRLVTGFVAGL